MDDSATEYPRLKLDVRVWEIINNDEWFNYSVFNDLDKKLNVIFLIQATHNQNSGF